MTATRGRPRKRLPSQSAADQHAEWLSLVQTTGPFLTVPTLKQALPDGLDAPPANATELRLAYAEWQANPELEQRWVRWVVDQLLDLEHATTEATDADPSHYVSEHGVTLRPSYVVRDHSQAGDPPVLLVHRIKQGQSLDRSASEDRWAATPLDRAAELARASGVPLALVTNGQRWSLVWARPGESTGICTWQAEIWLEEQITLRAFVTLLGAKRFLNLPSDETLANLLADSTSKQQEVADQLGNQVLRAVELLIATLDEQDRDRRGELLQGLASAEVYRGAVSVMMRLIFLFVAEERRLLPIEDRRYAEALAATTLRSQLQERADRYGEDPLERSTAAWYRILALFRAVHGGIEHEALRLPAYGGGLFDPDRFPFLEGRPPDSDWQHQAAHPLPVDDRTMLHILEALQTLEQGGPRVLLSYESLDVEQIGHVYEGLLDHTAVRITDAALALAGKHEPEIPLGEIEQLADQGRDPLIEALVKRTGRTANQITKGLETPPDDERRARLRARCSADVALLESVLPYQALLRDDLRGEPLVLLPGSLFVTEALDRTESGTYYTPRSLAEDVVRYALEPVVYHPGPAQEGDPAKWKLKPAGELLDLKVADITTGSGAFLVASCRYLAARLQEAWEIEAGGSDVGLAGPVSPTDRPADPLEREQLALRLVAERCLYGVDKNAMAVEMAKLSLWLITLAKDRPFSFVDHAIRHGDSLLGITDLEQLRVVHLTTDWHRQSTLDIGVDQIDAAVERALALRSDLESFVVNDVIDAELKAQMLADADGALDDARLLGDLVVGAALAQIDNSDPLGQAHVAAWIGALLNSGAENEDYLVARTQLAALAEGWLVERKAAVGEVQGRDWIDRDPFHWALEFPEVWERGGFDAIVGNPPFRGGKKITGALGTQYRTFLVENLANGVRGNADLVAYFYLRAATLLRQHGGFGLLATNTIAQGDTREVGLGQLIDAGGTVHRAIASQPWPGGASLEVATVWLARDSWSGPVVLDYREVSGITPSLTAQSRVTGSGQRLQANLDVSFQGTVVVGMGFVLSPAEAMAMLEVDEKNADVVRPYLVGDDLNSHPDGSPSRCVIDFRDWPQQRAAGYREPFARVEQLVRPERAKVNRKAHRVRWWQFGDKRPALYRTIAPLERCIAIAQQSNAFQPAFVSSRLVLDQQLVIFAYDDDCHFGLLSSAIHLAWALDKGSTFGRQPRYVHRACFETFPQVDLTEAVGRLGGELNECRSALMLVCQQGLTEIYNRVHDPDEHSDEIDRLRKIHADLDYAVRDAYGWTDLNLAHDFNETRFGTRFTLAPRPRQEVLDRLLELNHERYADEVKRGLHGKSKGKVRTKSDSRGTMGLDVGNL
jgi:hypothetical protein